MHAVSNLFSNIIIGLCLTGLIVVFTIKSIKRGYFFRYFTLAYFCLVIGILYHFVGHLIWPTRYESTHIMVELMFFGYFQLFFYNYLNSIQKFKRYSTIFLIVFILFLLQQFSLHVLLHFSSLISIQDDIWLVADGTYNINGLIISFVGGCPYLIKNYKKSKQFISLLLIFGFLLMGVGYLCLTVSDLFSFYRLANKMEFILYKIGNSLIIFSILLILFLYFLDIQQFFIIPHELFILVISNAEGKIIFQSKFSDNNPEKEIGFDYRPVIEGIDKFYQQFSGLKKPKIHIVENAIQILTYSENEINATIISNSTSRIIWDALKHFLRGFLKHFNRELDENNCDFYNSSPFINDTVEMVIQNFPFINIYQK
ncbi:hypothetical protein NEF87_000516 [Candidatus Lokiarchaeum ossiferum]|uniref:Histidine kinase N-terminal 7TM region domain-containing protein n=1 Tax=Candidatus Lokiarchaeum ossiferum TaxID=2951803 RepID=A0ABY6HL36_9ARCH|nr:hypothetical protein NEF87_000516 [Candidatus Lokiarchaeum sp. B-35]